MGGLIATPGCDRPVGEVDLGINDISNASFVMDMFASSDKFDSNWVWVFSPPTLSSLYSTELKITKFNSCYHLTFCKHTK